ncbi:expressed unknown protein [Ectocarpus siliculosus]|uniref:Uncharacterized protein n=1 Tax=Ectocarpus siliculosus TaxID=2880 RepID=D7G8T8_ECTSI|nr:expressed unknown protein [Ectocarpus siliculosus]|eukprot:CBJ28106.1 expressed unknown protein [Ectocarpus siliculosus]
MFLLRGYLHPACFNMPAARCILNYVLTGLVQKLERACLIRSVCLCCSRLTCPLLPFRKVWDGLRWDKHLPEHWDDPDAAAVAKQEAKATHYLGDTCKHKSHLFHSLTHYKLYLVSKVSAKIRGDSGLEPENFRGEGGPHTSKKKKKRCLNFSENEFESLSALLRKADDLNGVKWGGRAGVRGGHGKTFLEMGAASSILDWLSGEAQQGQYGDLDLGDLEGQRAGLGVGESEDEDEEEFHVGRGRRWRTVGSSGGRYG